jgi:hypothetical protein
MGEQETNRCLIEALAAAKSGDGEAGWVLYDSLEDEDGREKKFKCGQCALKMTVVLPRRANECNLEDIGVIKIPA